MTFRPVSQHSRQTLLASKSPHIPLGMWGLCAYIELEEAIRRRDGGSPER